MSGLYILDKPLDTTNKIIIDIKDIIDYSFCHNYYSLRRDDPNALTVRELYDISIHRTFYAYLQALQEGVLGNTLDFLKYSWGEEWIKYRYKSQRDFIIISSEANYDRFETKRKKGINALFTFNETMSQDKQFPIIINHKYQIEILPNVILTGTFEYVRELTYDNDKKVFQIMRFIPESSKLTTQIARQFDFELIAASYAFKEMFNVKDFQAIAWDIDKEKMFPVMHNEKEYETLKDIVKNVLICLQNGIKYIIPNEKCYNCEFRKHCIKML